MAEEGLTPKRGKRGVFPNQIREFGLGEERLTNFFQEQIVGLARALEGKEKLLLFVSGGALNLEELLDAFGVVDGERKKVLEESDLVRDFLRENLRELFPENSRLEQGKNLLLRVIFVMEVVEALGLRIDSLTVKLCEEMQFLARGMVFELEEEEFLNFMVDA